MNYIVLAFLVMTGLCVAVSVLFGLGRGLNRALLRLVIIILCAVLAFALRGMVIDKVLGTQIGEEGTVQDMIISMIPEDYQNLGDMAIDFAKVIVNAFVFMALFFVLQLFTWIFIFPICKLFIRSGEKKAMGGSLKDVKNKDRVGFAKKRKGFGALVGLAQGVVIAICLIMPLGAMVYQADRAIVAISDMNSSGTLTQAYASADEYGDYDDNPDYNGGGSSDSGEELIPAEIADMLHGFANSAIGKFYGNTCLPLFDSITAVKTENGKLTFSGIIDVVSEVPTLMERFEGLTEAFESLGELDWNDPHSLDALRDAMAALDDFNDQLPPAAKTAINTVVSGVVKSMAENVVGDSEDSQIMSAFMKAIDKTLEETPFTDIKFAAEIDVMQNLMNSINDITTADNINEEHIGGLLDAMADSTLILPIMENLDLNEMGVEEMDEETKEVVGEQLDQLVNGDEGRQRVVDVLKGMLGIAD